MYKQLKRIALQRSLWPCLALGLLLRVPGKSLGQDWTRSSFAGFHWEVEASMLHNRVQSELPEALLYSFMTEYTPATEWSNAQLLPGNGLELGLLAKDPIRDGDFQTIYGMRYAYRSWHIRLQDEYVDPNVQYDVRSKYRGRMHHQWLELFSGMEWDVMEGLWMQSRVGLAIPLADRFKYRYRVVRKINGERYDRVTSRSHDRSFDPVFLAVFMEYLAGYRISERWSASLGWKVGGNGGNWYGNTMNASAYKIGFHLTI